jgi:spore coat polysaccharide biosynthesis protein SpsF
MRTVAIIQARMGSSRLPGKVLERVEGLSVLAHTVRRAQRIEGVDRVVVATTVAPNDDAVVAECERLGVRCGRGSEDDVLSRYVEVARASEAEIVVRITSDCPLLDPRVSAEVVRALKDALSRGEPVDYASNTLRRRHPRGLDTEAFTAEALERAHRTAATPREREHVTLTMYEHPADFRLLSVSPEGDADTRGGSVASSHRWTVDTAEDLQLVREVMSRLVPTHGDAFGLEEILALVEREPWIAEINRHVEQKKA